MKLLLTPTSHVVRLGLSPALLLPLILASVPPGRQANHGSSTGVPAIHVGDLDWVVGSWLWLAPTLTLVSIWGVNEYLKDALPLSPITVCFKEK